MDRKTLGAYGERAAAKYLVENGYTIVDRNWRSEHGELDLIAHLDKAIVFVEVRTRASTQFGSPEESITQAKAERLILTAQAYIGEQSTQVDDWRIDLIAIECDPSGKVIRLDHYPHALMDYLEQPS